MSDILLIGCGHMGSAMARKWRDTHQVFVYDPKAEPLTGTTQITSSDFASLPQNMSVVLAVKPQIFPNLKPILAGLSMLNPIYISIMAGVTIDSMIHILGDEARIVRAMPNTPASIGKGMIVAVASHNVSADARKEIDALMRVSGKFTWIEDENLLDAVTALSGSGPAYFFRFTETLIQAGQDIGLPEGLARELARQTFIGAAALADHEEMTPMAELRENVTSPGGTTAAGLEALNAHNGLQAITHNCLKAAKNRSIALAKGSSNI